ncbi:MAG: preprotein translocase subunit SecE [Acidimicrobiales bacterium]
MNRQQRRQMQRRGDDSDEVVPDFGPVGRSGADGSVAVAGSRTETDRLSNLAGDSSSVHTAREALAPSRHRVGPRQFLHEVNVEMRKVAWPTRAETLNYSTVVLVTLAILMALIFGLDVGFQHAANSLFNP